MTYVDDQNLIEIETQSLTSILIIEENDFDFEIETTSHERKDYIQNSATKDDQSKEIILKNEKPISRYRPPSTSEKVIISEKRFISKCETQIPLHSQDISPT